MHGASIGGASFEIRVESSSQVAGSKPIKSLLSQARRAIKGKKPDPAQAAGFLAGAVAAFDQDLAWRKRAEAELKADLIAYDDAISDTIGLRGQPRLPVEQALYVAGCGAAHRDISLSF